jgi:hypothetical protein
MPAVRRFFFGWFPSPKAKRYGETSTPTTSGYYEGMNRFYRWFRQDSRTRKCIVTNAYFATLTAGFETALEATGDGVDTGDYAFVKERVDGLNKRVNMDYALFVAQVKRSIYGKSGFEIVLDGNGVPARLISLQSDRLRPEVSEDWELTGFEYRGRKAMYSPDEVLYFVNLGLEADHEGISDVEAVVDACQARHEILGENFPEIVRTLWAPYVVLKAQTEGLSREEADRIIEQLAEVARAGKSIAVNESVEATVVNLTPDIRCLTGLKDELDQEIMGNFGTPRFLIGKPAENRATAYAELEAYIEGTVAHIQRYLKREVERQWYDRWTLKALEKEDEAVPEGDRPPVVVKHRWRPIRVADVYEMAKAVASLWGSHGMGALSGRLEKAWELMGWDPSELERGG